MSNLEKCEKCENDIRFVVSFSEELRSTLPKFNTTNICIDCLIELFEETNPCRKITINDIDLIWIRGDNKVFSSIILESENGENRRIFI